MRGVVREVVRAADQVVAGTPPTHTLPIPAAALAVIFAVVDTRAGRTLHFSPPLVVAAFTAAGGTGFADCGAASPVLLALTAAENAIEAGEAAVIPAAAVAVAFGRGIGPLLPLAGEGVGCRGCGPHAEDAADQGADPGAARGGGPQAAGEVIKSLLVHCAFPPSTSNVSPTL